MNKQNLRARFNYDSSNPTNPLTYRTPVSGKYVGGRVGYTYINLNKPTPDHRIRCEIDGKNKVLARVVWSYFNGEIPNKMQVDHLDGNPLNNMIENLSLVTNKVNCRRATFKNSKANTSGMTGVSWQQSSKKWKVSIRSNGKLHYYGMFKALEEAKKVCKEKRGILIPESRRNIEQYTSIAFD